MINLQKTEKTKQQETYNELVEINNGINDMLKYCETVAQLATLARIQEHFVKLTHILGGKK